jgi:outer membrane protein OmpA-like peptidoglycan-associated protein
MKLKLGGRILVGIAILAPLAYYGNQWMEKSNIGKQVTAATVATKADVGGNAAEAAAAGQVATTVTLPKATTHQSLRVLGLPWNAWIGMQRANGGATTTPDSLMAQAGVNLTLERQDDYTKMFAEQLAFAAGVAAGEDTPTKGAAFTIIMGDGYPAYIYGAQKELAKIKQQLQVVGTFGFSRGEDKCMLPPEVKVDKQKARGQLVAAVLRDGDWNLCVKWATDNDIPINPDPKTYDPEALNFAAVDSFDAADTLLITKHAEDRPVIKSTTKNGVTTAVATGEVRHVFITGTATWTPGDVNVATKVGGVVSIASTKEYQFQMPAVLIGNRDWMAKHPLVVQNLLLAAFKGAELVRSSDKELLAGGAISAQIYKEQDAAYWAKYFKGTTQLDAKGQLVSLGGSSVAGLGDNAYYFGLNGAGLTGNVDIFKSVYTVYGGFAKHYYPDELPELTPYDQVVNKTYLEALLKQASVVGKAQTPKYEELATTSTTTFSQRDYSIEFDTGKATFTPKAAATLQDLFNNVQATGLIVQVNGHTDNVGAPASNMALSLQRANAVKAWLIANGQGSIPDKRVTTRAFGDTTPMADNASPAGRAANRRVEVLLLAN